MWHVASLEKKNRMDTMVIELHCFDWEVGTHYTCTSAFDITRSIKFTMLVVSNTLMLLAHEQTSCLDRKCRLERNYITIVKHNETTFCKAI